MMKIEYRVLIYLFLTIPMFSFAQTTQPSTQPTSAPSKMEENRTDNTSIQDGSITSKTLSEEGYEISYPETWTVDKSGQMGTSFFLFSPLSSEEDEFRENVNYIRQDVSAYNLTLAAYIELSMAELEKMISNVKLISNDTKTDERGLTYQRIEYTGEQGIYKLHFVQYIYLENNTVHILSFTAQQAEFQKQIGLGQKIMNSLIIK